jgi:hypothetical protein
MKRYFEQAFFRLSSTSSLFLILAFVALVVVQFTLIKRSRNYDSAVDLTIYREVGQLVAHGIDPYDFAAKQELRDQLRLDDYGLALKDNPAAYNYYVSGNLPASTLLYGVIKVPSRGSALGWRIGLALGNLGLFLATAFFLNRNSISLDRPGTQLAFSLSTIWYPSLLYWGTVLAQDKQFQITLMIVLAAQLSRPASFPRVSATLMGFTGALSLLFKAFGLFLAPVAIQYFLGRPKTEFACAVIVGALTTALFVFWFDLAFVDLMLARLRSSSAASIPVHGSPWTLYPAGLTYIRPLLSLSLIALAFHGYWRGRIDLLNLSAAIFVVFVCIWQRDGSMDRMNMAMIFAMICTATLSIRSWLALAVINSIVQYPIYDFLAWQKQYDAGVNAETLDAIATTIFVAGYFPILLWRRPSSMVATGSGEASLSALGIKAVGDLDHAGKAER